MAFAALFISIALSVAAKIVMNYELRGTNCTIIIYAIWFYFLGIKG